MLALLVLPAVLPGGLDDLEPWLARVQALGPLATAGLLALFTLLSEDLTCIAAGGLVAAGEMPFALAAAACFVGIFAGDVLLFLCGRWLGPRVLERAPLRWFVDEAQVASAAEWLERRGAVVILSSRFLPGARLPTYFASGALGMGIGRFALLFALAGLVWTPLLVGLAAGLGGGLARVEWIRAGGGWAVLGGLATAWVLLVVLRALPTRRGRGLLRARLRRIARFEYWPVGLFYLPVFALLLLKALRGRTLDFTAANPALPHGGFVGESKRDIHRLLEDAGAPLPRTLELPAGQDAETRRAAVNAFRAAHGLDLPLVVKPDAGQRGDGVAVLRDERALDAVLARGDEARALQEYVPGEEFGLFHARHPDEERGRLISIGRKALPVVVGDGRLSLEGLILASREHLPMAPLFLRRPASELERVPAAGEEVRLGELGTHCRGARFLDARELATPELEEAVERIARAIPGFHLGRFDVRAASDDALRAGRFHVLELNGVTSESAHMYDPSFGLLDAWAALLAQWRLAYDIGTANARAGARVSTLAELWAAVRAYRRLARRRETPRGEARTAPRGTPGEVPA